MPLCLAIKDIKSVSIGADIARVAPENLVSESEIAKWIKKADKIAFLKAPANKRDNHSYHAYWTVRH